MKMKIVVTWKKLAGLVVLGMGTALLVGWSGFVSISAASGHWTLTRWFLGWTMKNAVETQAMLITKPQSVDLDDPALILRSAGHYATGCAACHGAPGVPQSPVVEEMVPGPPRLEGKIGEWSDEELFWIVKNGIKWLAAMAAHAGALHHNRVADGGALLKLRRCDFAVSGCS